MPIVVVDPSATGHVEDDGEALDEETVLLHDCGIEEDMVDEDPPSEIEAEREGTKDANNVPGDEKRVPIELRRVHRPLAYDADTQPAVFAHWLAQAAALSSVKGAPMIVPSESVSQ